MTPSRPPAPRASSSAGWVRLAVALYFVAGVALGLLRLWRAGWDPAQARPVLTLWYVEALAFLAVWGGAACAKGLVSRRDGVAGRPGADGRRDDPLRAATLAALERRRGR